MDDLPLPQEADGRDDIGVINQAQDVIVGGAGFLLGGHILTQVGDGIAGGLKRCRRKGRTAGGLRPDAGGVIDKIGRKAGALDLLDGKIPGELVDNGTDHLQMCQFLGTRIVGVTSHTKWQGTRRAPHTLLQEVMRVWKEEHPEKTPATEEWLRRWRQAVLRTLREEGLLNGEQMRWLEEHLQAGP